MSCICDKYYDLEASFLPVFFFSLVNKQLNFLPQVWVGYQKNKLIVNISQASVQQNYDVGHTKIG